MKQRGPVDRGRLRVRFGRVLLVSGAEQLILKGRLWRAHARARESGSRLA
jgi:hypothetical protein